MPISGSRACSCGSLSRRVPRCSTRTRVRVQCLRPQIPHPTSLLDLARMEKVEENGWSLPAVIGRVVGKLHDYLENSSDSGKYKGTMKMLDLLEEKRKLLYEENLQRVNVDREEEMAAWLRLVKEATDDAEELVKDMEAEATPGNLASFDYSSPLRMKYTIGKLVSVFAEGESIVDVPSLESVQNDSTSLSPRHAPCLNENASEDEKNDKTSIWHDGKSSETKLLPDDDFLVGRDKEIAMIRDMVLGNAQYVAAAASLESREEANNLHMSQKGWIVETLSNIDQSKKTEDVPLQENKKTEDAADMALYGKEMHNNVEYTRVAHHNTVTNLRNPTVIPIVGSSGVGKSALARFIFQDGNVQEHFGDQSAWVCVTDRISLDEMIKQIIFSFSPEHVLPNLKANLKDVHTVLSAHQSIIEGKRFFLILDDVWNEIHAIWGGLRSVLSKGAPGSVVLVTTQLFGVASSIGTRGPIVLDPLQYDDSWTLLKHYAFAYPCSSQSMQVLEPIGRKIADRLHGLPLSVKIVGACLRSNLEESHWEKFLKGWWWNNRDHNLRSSIISSLGSCYCGLLGNVRQCFIYCSIFPRNYVFEKYKLVQTWIANGFVQLNRITGIRRLEDIAGEWFDELVNRAFLQPSACKTGYIMHDLVRDFAYALSSNEYHVTSDDKLRDISQIRYLSIEMDDLSVQPAGFCKQLRTLMLSGDSCEFFSGKACHHLDTILKSVTSLRILDFSSYRWSGAASHFIGYAQENYKPLFSEWLWTGIQTSPADARREFSPLDAISGLKYLRHLDLSFTGINRLPNSICSLCHLQVLGLRGCRFHMLPENMNLLVNLRHLHARSDTIAQIYGIGKLTKLQELHELCVKAEDGHRITELRNLNDIRGSLCISNLEMVADPQEALQANIAAKGHLTSLELKWSDKYTSQGRLLASDLTTGVLGGLSLPRNLQDLKLFGYQGDAFPNLVGLLRHVRVVEISSCKMLDLLPRLEQLEHLQKLKLHNLPSIKDINSEAYGICNVVFPSLEELSFEEMENWESWTCAGGREFIPNLQKLRIFRCPKLREVPLKSLGSATKEIFLERCGPHVISSYLQRLTDLTRLEIENSWEESGSRSDGILSIPCEQLTCLEYLSIKGFCEVRMKGGLWHLSNMKSLWISDCGPGAKKLDERKHVPTQSARVMHSLTHLTIIGHSMPTDLKNIFLYKTPSLRTICFKHMWSFPNIMEQWLQQLTSLHEMELYWCRTLPSSLGILSSLRKLTIDPLMPNYSIPPKSLPCNLKELQINRCPIELEARCQKPDGEVWPEEEKMVAWQRDKMKKWQLKKVCHGQRKLSELRQKKEEPEWLLKKWNEDKSSEEEFLLGEKDSWLKQTGKNDWPGEGQQGAERERKKLHKAFISVKDLPNREEWLEEEKRNLLKLKGMDWPNIAHVPYIRINRYILQNLYT